MRKYLCVASLFMLNNEVISWLALAIIGGMAVVALMREMERGGFFK